jgi:DNA-binding NarL/FixJ family response regulator
MARPSGTISEIGRWEAIGMKVLLVDDHVLFREGLMLLLAPLASPLALVSVGSCEEAFAALPANDDIDLVLMDLGLPGLGGLDGIRALHGRNPGLPVVALSSDDDKATVLAALDAGAMGFIPKSSSSSVMLGALKLILSHGIYLPPAVFLAGESGGTGLRQQAASGTSPSGRPSVRPSDLGLTSRQTQVLHRILQGKPAKVIGRELALSPSTVKSHTSAVLRALNVTTRTQAVVAAGRLGLRFDRTSDA